MDLKGCGGREYTLMAGLIDLEYHRSPAVREDISLERVIKRQDIL
jgi:hypothetical protein